MPSWSCPRLSMRIGGSWCDSLGEERIRTEPEVREGRLTGRYCHGDCAGAAKVHRIWERYDLSRYVVIDAYGDTKTIAKCWKLRIGRFTDGAKSPTGERP